MAESTAIPTEMTINTLLARFVAPVGEKRAYLRHPIRRDRWVYATDGCILVRVPDAPEIDANDAAEAGLSNLARLAECEINATGRAQVTIPSPLPSCISCATCNGTGIVRCPYCAGTGAAILGRSGNEIMCPSCLGRRIDIKDQVSVPCGPARFNPYYLHLIAALPGIALYVRDDSSPARFSFTGGDGLLMPMRKW